ncbi:MAG: hypothetical protein P8103_11880, partial [Candidatus Thiodiazotropha sp.]
KHHTKNTYFPRYYHAQLFMIFTVSALLSGCAGMMVDSLTRSGSTGDTYSEMKDTIPPPAEGTGRLYIYRTAASTETSYGPGAIGGSSKNRAWCDLDGKEFMLLWETFFYIDLTEGQHQLSCLSKYMRDVFSTSRNAKLRNTTVNKVNFLITNSSDTFVRLDATEVSKYIFQPIITDAADAHVEMKELPVLEEKERHRH